MSYQERALAIIDRLTDSKAINIRERGTLRRAILLPERPKGEWKLDSIGAYCSICETHPDYATNFCPICGADMRPEKEEGTD